jgi:outer membrane protein OmpA-like peptidoglycan-associated protein
MLSLKMKNKILFLFLLLFLVCPSPASNIYGEGKSKNDSIIIHFAPGTLQVTEQKLDIILNSLDKSKKYIIQGYACADDKDSDDEIISIAERRAEKIKALLLEHGFSNENITTIAYDKNSECKAIVIEIDE